MNSFMSWVGGKKSLRDEILIRFPLDYERYIEVFGGAGWVLFHKTPEAFEVFNDANSNLVNLYRCVRKNPRKLIKKLMFMINARDDFRCIVEQRRRGLFARFRDYDRAAKFYYLIQYSYGHKTDQYCCKPVSMWKKFPLIERAAARLQSVAIENRDFEALIKLYDRPNSFFYETAGTYASQGTSEFAKLFDEEEQLSQTLISLKSKADFEQNKLAEELKAEIGNTPFRLEEYDDVLVRKVVECVKVLNIEEISVTFKGGYEIKSNL